MRVFLVFISSLILNASFLSANSQGVLSLPDNSYNFGRVPVDGGMVSHQFNFVNQGDAPFLVTNVRTTCGCTTPNWSKEPILPGKSGFVEVVFNPEGRQGNFQKTIQIQSTASNSNMFVTISGNVVKPLKNEKLTKNIGALKVKSDQVNMGYLYKGYTGIEHLVIANPTNEAMQVSFDEVPPYMEVKTLPEVLNPGEYGQIEIRYNATTSDGWDAVHYKLPVRINGKLQDKSGLNISANIREDFRSLSEEEVLNAPVARFNKTVFNADTLTSDDALHCTFKLINNGERELVIRAVKPTCGCTAVKPEKSVLAPGESTQIEAVFSPEGRSGDFKTSIAVITNDPKNYKQYLYVVGHIGR